MIWYKLDKLDKLDFDEIEVYISAIRGPYPSPGTRCKRPKESPATCKGRNVNFDFVKIEFIKFQSEMAVASTERKIPDAINSL